MRTRCLGPIAVALSVSLVACGGGAGEEQSSASLDPAIEPLPEAPSREECEAIDDMVWDMCVPDDEAPYDAYECLGNADRAMGTDCCVARPYAYWFCVNFQETHPCLFAPACLDVYGETHCVEATEDGQKVATCVPLDGGGPDVTVADCDALEDQAIDTCLPDDEAPVDIYECLGADRDAASDCCLVYPGRHPTMCGNFAEVHPCLFAAPCEDDGDVERHCVEWAHDGIVEATCVELN